MKIITIKDAIIDGKFLKKGSEMDVDKERSREFMVLGIIENSGKIQIKQAILKPTETRKRK
jgi:hypothetical protein